MNKAYVLGMLVGWVLVSGVITAVFYLFNKAAFSNPAKENDKMVWVHETCGVRYNEDKNKYYAHGKRVYYDQPLRELPVSKMYKSLDDIKRDIISGKIKLKYKG